MPWTGIGLTGRIKNIQAVCEAMADSELRIFLDIFLNVSI